MFSKIGKNSKRIKTGERQKSERRSSFEEYSVPKKRKLDTESLQSEHFLTEDESSRHESEYDNVSEIESEDPANNEIENSLENEENTAPLNIRLRSLSSLRVSSENTEENSRPELQSEDEVEGVLQIFVLFERTDCCRCKIFSTLEIRFRLFMIRSGHNWNIYKMKIIWRIDFFF